MMNIRLTILSALEVLAFVGALIVFLRRIVTSLERIGGSPTSSLAKIRFGVRAIEKQTSHLGPQVTRLNQNLTLLGGKLHLVDGHLAAVDAALAARPAEPVEAPR